MAETVKFTEARVAAIRARVKSGRVEFQDAELLALRLRVSPTSAAWSVPKRIPGGPMSPVPTGKGAEGAACWPRKLARECIRRLLKGVGRTGTKRRREKH